MTQAVRSIFPLNSDLSPKRSPPCVLECRQQDVGTLVIRVSSYLQMLGEHLSYVRLIFCFQGDRKEGQSIPLALAIS